MINTHYNDDLCEEVERFKFMMDSQRQICNDRTKIKIQQILRRRFRPFSIHATFMTFSEPAARGRDEEKQNPQKATRLNITDDQFWYCIC